jgi:hypothetical protein
MKSSMLVGVRCSPYFQPTKAIEWLSLGNLVCLTEERPNVLFTTQQPHYDLANMRDDDGSVKKFVAKWGPLHNSVESVKYSRQARLDPDDDEAVVRLLRNNQIPDATALYIESKDVILHHRDWLRAAWGGKEDEWLRSPMAGEDDLRQTVAQNASWKFSSGRIEIQVRDLWSAICVLFLRDCEAGKVGVCGNPDCPAQFFFKKKSDQKFCERGPCLNYGRKKNKRDWWKDNGEAWRAERKNKGRTS